MFYKFICCDVFARMATDLVAKSPHIIDLEFLPMLEHVEPEKLHDHIQDRIDKSLTETARKYDAILLGFGLCGNATVGLNSSVPLVIPRAHDCCAIHMGSKERFLECFGNNLSARWCSTGYFERAYNPQSGYPVMEQLANYKTTAEYMGYLEEYDEETAEYLWESMHPPIEMDEAYYIRVPGYEYSGGEEYFGREMERNDVKLITVEGSPNFLSDLINGNWDEDRFLVIQPGQKIGGVYDMDRVMEAI